MVKYKCKLKRIYFIERLVNGKANLELTVKFLDRRIAELEERIGSMYLNKNASIDMINKSRKHLAYFKSKRNETLKRLEDMSDN